MCVVMSMGVYVCAQVFPCDCMLVNAKRYMLKGRAKKSEQEEKVLEEGREGRGVNFDMSFLKLSFDN